MESYGIVWRAGGPAVASGKLELLASGLRLEGMAACRPVAEEIPYEELKAVRVGRGAADRIAGRPTLVVERRAAPSVEIASVAEPGAVGELVERLAHRISALA